MAKRDCELRPNRSHLTTLVWKEGLSRKQANGRMPQGVTQNQIDYMNFLMQKLDDAGIKYPVPNMKSLLDYKDRFTINPNKRLVMKQKIHYMQTLCKQNGVDISEWVKQKPPKEVYKPYSAGAVAIKKLSVRKG